MNSKAWRLVAAPAVALIVVGSSALAAVPALADGATAPATAAATAAPAATAVPTDTSTAVPTGTSTSTATSTPTAAPTSTAAPRPRSAAVAAAPTDLTLTSPVTQNDFDEVDVHDPRAITIAGTAPTGSKLKVTDGDGTVIATLTTTATTFSIPLTFEPNAAYEQDISVVGTAGTKKLTEWDFFLVFVDTPQSPAPTLTGPLGTTSYIAAPQPFLGFVLGGIAVTGTGTPGQNIGIATTEGDPADGYDGVSFDGTKVAADGTWSDVFFPGYGTYTISAVQTVLNENFDETTVESDPSNSAVVTVTLPAGTVDAPEITTPAYPDDATTQVTAFVKGRAVVHAQISHPARTQAAKVDDLAARTAALTSKSTPLSIARSAVPLASAARAAGAAASPKDDFTTEPIDQVIAEDGIQVVGKPSAAHPGLVGFTVAGTGTPGDDIVLYGEHGDPALSYFSDLYPTFFDAMVGGTEFAPLPPVTSTPVAPAVVTTGGSTGDPAATASLPADDGSIVVRSDGTWSTTLYRKPGSYIVDAWAVEARGASAAYSVASPTILVHLTGDPAVVPAATGELAFTGSRGTLGIAGGGFAALATGIVLLGVSRRRRSA